MAVRQVQRVLRHAVGVQNHGFLKSRMLEYYYRNGYTYIELGDGEELWENRKLRNKKQDTVFRTDKRSCHPYKKTTIYPVQTL